jgi:MraZ protein
VGTKVDLSPGFKFVGNFPRSLDVKGRVILPSRMRTHFEEHGYLTPGTDGCLALWPEEEFELEAERQHAKDALGPEARNDLRDWAALVTRVEFDRQNRMPVPSELREIADLEQEVLFVGVLDRVELWSPQRWAARRAQAVGASSSQGPGRE